MNIDGKTRLLGLLGDPVEHTMSPIIHNTLSEILDINEVYVPFHTKEAGLSDAVAGAYQLNVLGLNATVPHKKHVMECLCDIDEGASVIGAVNTLVRTDKGYKGYNTDMLGLSRELEVYGIDIRDREVVILGAGGAARAVAYMCVSKGAASVYILNRTVAKAEEIAADMNRHFGRKVVNAMALSEYSKLPGYKKQVDNADVKADKVADAVTGIETDTATGISTEIAVDTATGMSTEIETDTAMNNTRYIVFQSTSIGLAPRTEDVVIEDEAFYQMVSVGVDLIYNPFETKFMKLCRKSGAKAYNGLRMLLYQGIIAYELWNDIKISEEVADRVYSKMLANLRKNVTLIGFMGSGKTTVGKALANRLGLSFVDTDSLVEEKYDMSISDMFEAFGEECFRGRETKLLSELNASLSGSLLSTGGGLPLRTENVELLRQMGPVVYLRVSGGEVINRLAGDSSRPLLSGDSVSEKVNNLLSYRQPIYEAAADYIVDVDGKAVDDIVEEISGILIR
jgi:shikimate dehydrogenase